MPQQTPLHDKHEQLGGRMVEFAGTRLPVQYESVLAEHRRCRAVAALFDTSHMGQLLLEGPDAPGAIAGVCTQNAETLKVGRCRYGFLLNESGGVLDDTILMRLGEERFLLVVNAGTRGGDLAHVRAHLPERLGVIDRLDDGWGKIDLQGPEAFAVLDPLCENLASMKFFSVREAVVDGRAVTLARTGYTGELGWEIMGEADDLLALWDRLLEHPQVAPAGLGARDSLRLEMAYPLYGHELSVEVTPIEAAAGGFVDLKRDFLGVERLRGQIEQGPEKLLVGLRAETRRRANPGDEIHRSGGEFPEHRRHVGAVTSGGFSPSLECSIALGYVSADCAEPGTELIIATRRAELPVTVVERPFYKEGTCRATLGGRPSNP